LDPDGGPLPYDFGDIQSKQIVCLEGANSWDFVANDPTGKAWLTCSSANTPEDISSTTTKSVNEVSTLSTSTVEGITTEVNVDGSSSTVTEESTTSKENDGTPPPDASTILQGSSVAFLLGIVALISFA